MNTRPDELVQGGRQTEDALRERHIVAPESHPPRKIVNLLFTMTKYNIKLTVLWGN